MGLREALVAAARADERLSGVALTGSGTQTQRWPVGSTAL
jgi:hypothetical protein